MEDGEAIGLLQTDEHFVAMLAETMESIPNSPRRKLHQGREICILYLLTGRLYLTQLNSLIGSF